MKLVKGVLIPATGCPHVLMVEDDFRTISALINANTIDVVGSDRISVYVDDEGILRNRPINLLAATTALVYGAYNGPLFGDALILGPVDDEGDDTDVSDEILSALDLPNHQA